MDRESVCVSKEDRETETQRHKQRKGIDKRANKKRMKWEWVRKYWKRTFMNEKK